PDEWSLLLGFEQAGRVCCNTKQELARISLVEAPPAAPERPLHFAQFLRAHVARARCTGVRAWERDRQIALRLETADAAYDLLLSLLGARSNLYLLDASGVLLYALRSLEETRRELEIGQPWRDPAGGAPREGIDRWAEVPDERYF